MNHFFIWIMLAYSIFPIWIIIMIPQATERQVVISRIKHAIPALLLTVMNISALIYYLRFQKIPFMIEGTYLYLIPPLFLLLVAIVWNAGRRTEKWIQMELAGREIERIRFQKGAKSRHVIASSIDDAEML